MVAPAEEELRAVCCDARGNRERQVVSATAGVDVVIELFGCSVVHAPAEDRPLRRRDGDGSDNDAGRDGLAVGRRQQVADPRVPRFIDIDRQLEVGARGASGISTRSCTVATLLNWIGDYPS